MKLNQKLPQRKKTSQITGAMQMVSAAKLQKSESHAKRFQIYASKVHQVTVDLISHDREPSKNPMLLKRPVKKKGYLVITSDRGLVGGYNANILKSVMSELMKEQNDDAFSVMVLGGMGADFFSMHVISKFLMN